MLDLNILNPNQKEAVLNTKGPLLVLAGAGTGKTTVITYKIAHLLAQNICTPNNILAVTFTNKAAYQMQDRIMRLCGQKINYLGTFHSTALRILRIHANLIDLASNLTIIDYPDQIKLIKNIYIDHNFDNNKLDYKAAHHLITSWKDLNLFPDQVNHHDKTAISIYKHYQDRLQTANLADFGDILLYVNKIFDQYQSVLEMYQEQFDYILVDEYQDTNKIQYEWVRKLAGRRQNICCVGDDDQSIYSWRGAQVSNILGFHKDFPNTQIITLSHNYRSTQKILDVAQSIIANNKDRYDKNLKSSASHLTNPIKLVCCTNSANEAEFISQEVLQLPHDSSVAVLVRTNFQTRILEDIFLRNKINYKIIGTTRFYELKEVKDVLAYIRATLNVNDDIALERIINVPKRGIGDASMAKFRANASDYGISLHESIKMMLNAGQISKKGASELEKLMQLLGQWKKYFVDLKASDAVERMLEEAGYMMMLAQNTFEQSRLENIKELLVTITEYDDIYKFLEHAALVNEEKEEDSGFVVKVMTVHGAKGLEFDTVFLPNWNQGIFPSSKGMSNLAEERRIAYVAVTRAKYNLCISYSTHMKTKDNYYAPQSPSQFALEIKEDLLVKDSFPSFASPSKLHPGMKIFHKIFGAGLVIKELDYSKYEIAFKDSGIKVIHKDFLSTNV